MKMAIVTKIDATTKRWIRNASDEAAAANGCRFDEERGQFVIDFAAKYLRLYEGDCAGEPLIAHDWQIEATMRLFSWIRWSERWNRWVRRFTKASIWVPKKNKKSPTLAWWGLYLTCADGEQGGKTFFFAKDGSQAREIAAKHAIEMVLASPELLDICTINRVESQITHESTRSTLKPQSSADAKTQKSKEGINGNCLVDETHVVDRACIARISRAGISRSEPLHIEVSTAGDDPQSYGKYQWDYGRQVESGTRTDERFFFLAYAAPQDLTDEDLAKDPVKYGKMANPAWGHTIDEAEYLDDYHRSSASLSDLADFKKYRLNVWQSASNPAIREQDWAACRHAFVEKNLEGRRCFSALDLGLKHDSTALVHLFPWETAEDYQIYRLLVRFWLPRETAHAERKDVAWLDWGASGHIKITDGNTTDFALVKRTILEDAKKFHIVQLGYDERFAHSLCQELQDDHGLNVCPYPQTPAAYNEPCLLFETNVLEHRILHQGNPCMHWQTSVLTFKDRSGLKMPAKPESNRIARIDGPAAAIMALALATNDKADNEDWYVPGCLRN